jgi:hypothetical protein
MSTDSRISDARGTLIDEGVKLFTLPMVCRMAADGGFFNTTYYTSAFGMACAGGTLVYQHVHATLVPLLAALIGDGTSVPTALAVAMLAADVTTQYVRALGATRPDHAHQVSIVIGGQTAGMLPEAYEVRLAPDLDGDGRLFFQPHRLPLEDGDVYFTGDRVAEANDRLAERRSDETALPIVRGRAPLDVIRSFIDDPSVRTIGGEVQVGYTTPDGFQRVASLRAEPIPDRPANAALALNGISIDALPSVGPCAIGLGGMIVPNGPPASDELPQPVTSEADS